MNFKEETIEKIKESGYKLEDVMFVGSNDGKLRINIEKFLEISDFEYDSGYGSAEISGCLIVYFNDKSYLARDEYDGSEWWEYVPASNFSKDDNSDEFIFEKDETWYCYLLKKV